jgi:hypothetical protein
MRNKVLENIWALIGCIAGYLLSLFSLLLVVSFLFRITHTPMKGHVEPFLWLFVLVPPVIGFLAAAGLRGYFTVVSYGVPATAKEYTTKIRRPNVHQY